LIPPPRDGGAGGEKDKASNGNDSVSVSSLERSGASWWWFLSVVAEFMFLLFFGVLSPVSGEIRLFCGRTQRYLKDGEVLMSSCQLPVSCVF